MASNIGALSPILSPSARIVYFLSLRNDKGPKRGPIS